jgi:DHA2 family multidrug resistance protein
LADGTGFFNLARQLGGSAGIAALSTYLDHSMRTHWAVLAEAVTPYSHTTQVRLTQMQYFFQLKGSSAYIAHQRALAALSGRISAQSYVLGFNNSFYIIVLVFIAMIPLIFLLRRTQLVGGPPIHVE